MSKTIVKVMRLPTKVGRRFCGSFRAWRGIWRMRATIPKKICGHLGERSRVLGVTEQAPWVAITKTNLR
ncbi:MAG: hypothetical protein ACE5I5_05330 [Candidatus Heimdallarchaeota archaeon]